MDDLPDVVDIITLNKHSSIVTRKLRIPTLYIAQPRLQKCLGVQLVHQAKEGSSGKEFLEPDFQKAQIDRQGFSCTYIRPANGAQVGQAASMATEIWSRLVGTPASTTIVAHHVIQHIRLQFNLSAR